MKMLSWLIVFLAVSLTAFCQDDKTKTGLPSDDNEVRVSRGLRYSVPKDWPMDERNGGISPVPIEDYMLMKFKKIDERLAALESKVNSKQDAAAPVEAKKMPDIAGTHLQSFEQKPAILEGEAKKNEKESS